MKKGQVYFLFLGCVLFGLLVYSSTNVQAYDNQQLVLGANIEAFHSAQLTTPITFSAYPGQKVIIYSNSPAYSEYTWGQAGTIGTCHDDIFAPNRLFVNSRLEVSISGNPSEIRYFSASDQGNAQDKITSSDGGTNCNSDTSDPSDPDTCNHCAISFNHYGYMDITDLFFKGGETGLVTKSLIFNIPPNNEGDIMNSGIFIGTSGQPNPSSQESQTSEGSTETTSEGDSQGSGSTGGSEDTDTPTPKETNKTGEKAECAVGKYSLGRYVIKVDAGSFGKLFFDMESSLTISDNFSDNGKMEFVGHAKLNDISGSLMDSIKKKSGDFMGKYKLVNDLGANEDFFSKGISRILQTKTYDKTWGEVNFLSEAVVGSSEKFMIYSSGEVNQLTTHTFGADEKKYHSYNEKTNVDNVMGPFTAPKTAKEFTTLINNLIVETYTKNVELKMTSKGFWGKDPEFGADYTKYFGKNTNTKEDVIKTEFKNGVITFYEKSDYGSNIDTEYYPPSPEKDIDKLLRCVEFYKKKAAVKAATQPATQPAVKASIASDSGLYAAFTSGNPEIQTIPTNSFSVFMVRNNSDYTGIAYHMTPHYNFSQSVMVIFNDSSGDVLHLNDDILNFCNYTIIRSSSETINSSGGALGISGKVLDIFPEGAVNNSVRFTIDEIDITSCNHCANGVQDSDEKGVDCGGNNCKVCAPSCFDGIMNGDETGVDCGGNCINDFNESDSCGFDINKDCHINACPTSCTTKNECLMCNQAFRECIQNKCVCNIQANDFPSISGQLKLKKMSFFDFIRYLIFYFRLRLNLI